MGIAGRYLLLCEWILSFEIKSRRAIESFKAICPWTGQSYEWSCNCTAGLGVLTYWLVSRFYEAF